jgi:cellulose synthase/poly-beta-1,6-N-acetylglucosamine synthase-like glycosyltransferase
LGIADQLLELSASNAADGGVFVISGRAACFRAEILTDRRFLAAFVDEYFAWRIFGRWIGPLHADDDNCITRWLVTEGWKIKFQHTPHACITTSLGVNGPHKWLQQCIRWSRTTVRSNLTSLSSPHVWYTYPWTTATVYIPALCNYALLIDPALIWFGWNAALEHHIRPPVVLVPLVLWMLVTKTAKLYPHLRAYPRDIGLLPVQFAFGYAHSLIKLYLTLTFWVLGWGSRLELDLPQARDTYRSPEGGGEPRPRGAAMEKGCN